MSEPELEVISDSDSSGVEFWREEGDTSDHSFDLIDVAEEDALALSTRRRRRNALAHIMDEENSEGEDDDETEIEEEDGEEDLLSLAMSGSERTQTATEQNETTSDPIERTTPPQQLHSTPQPSTSIKRKPSSPMPNPSPKKARDSFSSQDDDADCCPICFEPWSNSGKHKLASLKCGHLFGQKCIERWIKDAKKCPQCNAKARKVDVRVLYAKKLKAIDTTELTEAVTLYESEKELRRKKEMELAKSQMQYQIAMTEVARLKSQIEDLKNNQVVSSLPSSVRDSISQSSSSRSVKKFSHFKNILISSTGNCRVMDYHAESLSLGISQPSPHANFMTGFGLKKFSVADMKSCQFNILHTKVIKDVRFSPHSNLVLTASQDETLKITNWESNSHVHTFKPQRPVWCCCWDSLDSNLVYAGLSNGLVHCYDLRFTTNVVKTISNPESRCPIVTLYHVPHKDDPHVPGGLLVQTLEGVTLWRKQPSAEYSPYILPLSPGSCAGLQYCDRLKQCLVTYRPGRSYPTTSHILCQLNFTSGELGDVSTDVIEQFRGGQTHKMLTRNALFSTSSTGNLVCIGDEAKKIVNIYEAKSRGGLVQSLSCSGPALDILPITVNETTFLTTLTEKELKIYEQK